MWFTNTQVLCEDTSIEIIAATPLAANWITKRFTAVIEDAAKETFGKTIPIQISVDSKSRIAKTEQTQVQQVIPQSKPKRVRQHLLSFDDFVVGTCNQLACSAAKQITQEDGSSISPLFIHGACGVGKTHLLQAICKRAAKTSPGKVRYVTAEQFTNEFISSSRAGEFNRFRNRYRFLDVLAIDDVHFVASKIKTQEELLHTLDAAGLRGAKLVLASDEDPRHIRRLNRALANRFVAGLIAEIKRPDRETRLAIIKRLTVQHQIELTQGAIERLASQSVGSVREIEGTVTRLRATASLIITDKNAAIGSEIVERVLRATPPNTLPIRINDVIEATSSRAGISVLDLRGKSRAANIVFWRSVASYLGRKLTTLSYPELASALGRKNHSTVHAAVKKMTELLRQEDTTYTLPSETIEVEELIDQLTWSIRSLANDNKSKNRASERNRGR